MGFSLYFGILGVMTLYSCLRCKQELSIFSFSKRQRSLEGDGLCRDCDDGNRDGGNCKTCQESNKDNRDASPHNAENSQPQLLYGWHNPTFTSRKEQFRSYLDKWDCLEKEKKLRCRRDYGKLRLM